MGGRNYGSGDRTALVVEAQGRCYSPDCPEPLFRILKGHRVNNYDIAHIKALNPGGPRYDAEMTDAERNCYRNVLLLCSAHHRLIDRIAPDDHPVDLLQQWKVDRGVPGLSSLTTVTEDSLNTALDEALQRQTDQLLDAIQKLRAIDPTAAASVARALDAAEQLSHLPSSSNKLLNAAGVLANLKANASRLLAAAEMLRNLSNDADKLFRAAESAKDAARQMRRSMPDR
jgi:hypothetical protein